MTEKRALSPEPEDQGDKSLVEVKKPRTDDDKQVSLAPLGIKRTSNLSAPVLQLDGHQGEVFSVKFSPDGQCLASSSFDRSIFLWRTYDENENYLVLTGHKNAVLDLQWFADGERLLTCSADKTVRAWDLETGSQIKKLSEHTKIVNSCSTSRIGAPVFASGSDDGLVKIWDLRVKRSVATFRDDYAICAVAMSDAGDTVFSGGLDNTIRMWELRRAKSTSSSAEAACGNSSNSSNDGSSSNNNNNSNSSDNSTRNSSSINNNNNNSDKASMVLEGHSDTITGLRLSPDGSHLLSNAMDNTLRIWDIRPYAPLNRCTAVLVGHMHTYEKNLLRCGWSADGKRVTCGSADRLVHVWDVETRKETFRLPGHKGSVNEVCFHPTEPILASASSDKTLFLGELL